MTANKKISGVVKGKSHVAYVFEFPQPSEEETDAYLQKIAKCFLTFLQKQSENPCDFVRYGGIKFEKAENVLTLHVAFCPFAERSYRKVAVLELDDRGKIRSVKQEKRSRRNSP